MQQERRPGRPTSTREDLIKQRLVAEEREYDNGFWIPDMEGEKNRLMLRGWNGDWTSLSTLEYVRLARNGAKTRSSFPPNGMS